VLYARHRHPPGDAERPRTKGERLGTPTDLAATLALHRATITRYGKTTTVELAETHCLW
jgi:hypothetical protein